MSIPQRYNVDFGSYAQDFKALVQERLLDQFKGKPVLTAVLNAFADECQEAFDAVLEMLRQRTLYNASGVNLDAIGRIVGQRRELIVNGTAIYFTPDTTNLCADKGLAWVTGAPTSGTQPPTDGQYAMQVLGRIYSNMNRFSSVPELQAVIREVLGLDVTFEPVDGQPMTVNIRVHNAATASPDALAKLSEARDTSRCNGRFFLPYSATLTVAEVITGE